MGEKIQYDTPGLQDREELVYRETSVGATRRRGSGRTIPLDVVFPHVGVPGHHRFTTDERPSSQSRITNSDTHPTGSVCTLTERYTRSQYPSFIYFPSPDPGPR